MIAMSGGPIPLVSVGTLSGNLPTGAGARTLGSAPLAAGQSFTPVGLDESNAVTGVTLNAYSSPKIGADTPDTVLMQQQLLAAQEETQL
jgi:hypothetical protein